MQINCKWIRLKALPMREVKSAYSLPYTFQWLIAIACLALAGCGSSSTSYTQAYIATNQPDSYYQSPHPQNTRPAIRLSFIGDAGSALGGAAKAHLDAISQRSLRASLDETFVFLGDNIYVNGFQSDDLSCNSTHDNARRLSAILDVGRKANAPTIVVPGNHDWDETDNVELLYKQKHFVEKCGHRTRFEPANGETLSLVSSLSTEYFRLIFLDSQAIINGPENAKIGAFRDLEKALQSHDSDVPIIIAAHHPFSSHGPHGGCYQNDYFGSGLINVLRAMGFGWGQDINESIYQDYIKTISALIPDNHKTLFIAGHDHNLQLMQPLSGPDYSVVSGSGSKTSRVCAGNDSLFSQQVLGYMELDFFEDGSVYLRVLAFDVEHNNLNTAYRLNLFGE